MEKLVLKQALIVEGKYDKHRLSSVVDGLIIITDGFGIFSDDVNMSFIKQMANERGVIILTDSDHAGFAIRHYISGALPQDRVWHAYIPDIYGKERRKAEMSKEKKLGVEGMETEVLVDILKKAAVETVERINADPITKYDLYDVGLTGGTGSYGRRKELLSKLSMPERMSCNAMLKVFNILYSRDQFYSLIAEIFAD